MKILCIAALLILCGVALTAVGKSKTLQESTSKSAAQQDDIPRSIADSISGTLQFAEGNFLDVAEAMPENKYSFVPTAGILVLRHGFSNVEKIPLGELE